MVVVSEDATGRTSCSGREVVPNHWHVVLGPEQDGDLAAFMQQLTTKHVRRWQLHGTRVGYGHVYQGRYKSFPVAEEGSLSGCPRCGSQLAAGGVGRAFGDGSSARRINSHCSAHGPWLIRRTGASSSTNRKRRRRWMPFVAVWPGASPTEARIGSAKRRNNSDWNQHSEHRTDQERPQPSNDFPEKAPLPSFLPPYYAGPKGKQRGEGIPGTACRPDAAGGHGHCHALGYNWEHYRRRRQTATHVSGSPSYCRPSGVAGQVTLSKVCRRRQTSFGPRKTELAFV